MPQRLSDVNLGSLVPETLTWDNGRPIDPGTWIGFMGRYDHLIAYAELLWPDFVEHDGCILRAGFGEENYRGFLEANAGDKRAVETVINHVHIIDLIHGAYESGPTDEQSLYLGRLLKEMWQAKLAQEFPARRFVVTFDEEGDSVYDFVVTFHQEPGSHPDSTRE
jgi:hypothetical protein